MENEENKAIKTIEKEKNRKKQVEERKKKRKAKTNMPNSEKLSHDVGSAGLSVGAHLIFGGLMSVNSGCAEDAGD
jgi:hypothetical protein